MTVSEQAGAMPASGIRMRRGAALALLAFAQLIYSLDINIVFVALPEIGASLGFSGQTLQWVVSAYMVLCGGFLLFGGRAADLIGQRRMFIFALWLYALSSLAGGLAWSPEVIIVARAVQGIGGASCFRPHSRLSTACSPKDASATGHWPYGAAPAQAASASAHWRVGS